MKKKIRMKEKENDDCEHRITYQYNINLIKLEEE